MAIQCLVLSSGQLKTFNNKNRWEAVGSEEELTSDLILTNGFLYDQLNVTKNKIYIGYIQTDSFEDGSVLYETEDSISQSMNPISLDEVTLDGEDVVEVTVPDYTIADGIGDNDLLLVYSEDEGFVPIIKDLALSSNTTHNNAVGFTFNVVYNYDTKLKYRFKINAGDYTNWSELQDPYRVFSGSIPFNLLSQGVNAITIEVASEDETISNTYTLSEAVTVENGIPSFILLNDVSDNFRIHFQIMDPDADLIKYRLILNNSKLKDHVLSDWSDFIPSAQSILYYIDTTNVVVNESNIIKIEYQDEYGSSGSYTYVFKGTYKNLVFIDEDGEYLTTDKGVLLKILDFNTLLAGDQTEVKEVKIQNNNSTAITNLTLNINYTKQVEGVTAQISKTKNPFVPANSLDYGDAVIEIGESKTFYVRMDTLITAQGKCTFDIFANASIYNK